MGLFKKTREQSRSHCLNNAHVLDLVRYAEAWAMSDDSTGSVEFPAGTIRFVDEYEYSPNHIDRLKVAEFCEQCTRIPDEYRTPLIGVLVAIDDDEEVVVTHSPEQLIEDEDGYIVDQKLAEKVRGWAAEHIRGFHA